MQSSELALLAEELLGSYRDFFLIDPFFRITVDVSELDSVSKCEPDTGALSWRIRLSPSRHLDLNDVKYSVVDGLLRIMFAEADRVSKRDDSWPEARDAVLVRLVTIFCNLLPDLNSAETENTSADDSDTQGE